MLGLKLIHVGIRLVYCRNNRRRSYLGASFEIRYLSTPVKYCVSNGLDRGANLLYLTVETVYSSVNNSESAIFANNWATHGCRIQERIFQIYSFYVKQHRNCQTLSSTVGGNEAKTYVVYCWVQCYTYESLALDRMLSPTVFISATVTSQWALITGVSIFSQPFVQAQIKAGIKVLKHCTWIKGCCYLF